MVSMLPKSFHRILFLLFFLEHNWKNKNKYKIIRFCSLSLRLIWKCFSPACKDFLCWACFVLSLMVKVVYNLKYIRLHSSKEKLAFWSIIYSIFSTFFNTNFKFYSCKIKWTASVQLLHISSSSELTSIRDLPEKNIQKNLSLYIWNHHTAGT